MSNARYTIFAARAVFDVDREKGISATELRVLAALGTYTNDEGWCYPNQTTLAERLQVTRQTISSAIRKLVARGYVETEVRTAKGRGKVGYNYRVVLDVKRAEAEPQSEAEKADNGDSRQRPPPTTAPADFGADRDPLSANADIPYKEVTNPSERAQQSSPTSNEVEEDVAPPRGDDLFGAGETPPPPKPKKRKRSATKRATYTPEFNAVWLSWPAHRRANSDKQTAFKRYKTGVEQFGADAIAKAAERYLSLPDTRKENFRYCCLVEVFMNGKLEAAVEAAIDAPDEKTTLTHDEIELASARRYFEKTGKWPQGVPKPQELHS